MVPKYLKKNIEMIKNWQNKMRFADPFCDFDLIFSAAYSSQKIVELPIHYRSENTEKQIYQDLEMDGNFFLFFKFIYIVQNKYRINNIFWIIFMLFSKKLRLPKKINNLQVSKN